MCPDVEEVLLAQEQVQMRLDVRRRDVLVMDDILDTGLSLVKIRELPQKRQPRSLKFCVFLETDVPRHQDFKVDYVGYRLDFRECYRNLPYVVTLKPDAIATQP
jgi:hypoxanthine phosphoribosyltransferase